MEVDVSPYGTSNSGSARYQVRSARPHQAGNTTGLYPFVRASLVHDRVSARPTLRAFNRRGGGAKHDAGLEARRLLPGQLLAAIVPGLPSGRYRGCPRPEQQRPAGQTHRRPALRPRSDPLRTGLRQQPLIAGRLPAFSDLHRAGETRPPHVSGCQRLLFRVGRQRVGQRRQPFLRRSPSRRSARPGFAVTAVPSPLRPPTFKPTTVTAVDYSPITLARTRLRLRPSNSP